MARCLFLYPNLSDQRRGATPGAELRGGGWILPLVNAQNRILSKVARSRSLLPADTQFDVVFDAYGEIRAIVLVNHNFSPTARWRLTAWDDDGSYYDHAYQVETDVYPTLGYPEDTPFERANWFDQKPLLQDLEGFTQNAIHVLPEPRYERHWRIEVIDEENEVEYLQFGRLWMATGWQPSHNMAYGSSALAFDTATTSEASMSGAKFFDPCASYRTLSIGFQNLPEQEALARGLELMRRAGKHGELFYIDDPDDAENLTRTSFLCHFEELLPWERVAFERANIGFRLEELL
ncbi:hypothetical protein [Aureimonas sp. ME7]|uniref:hypothetical protein n=1 Tax=Aureimonas sp. ME7 TaxID=2744252 RepID=UPI0015F5F2A0|nr:hypothetical protein [Aureimonas sp. ME7]